MNSTAACESQSCTPSLFLCLQLFFLATCCADWAGMDTTLEPGSWREHERYHYACPYKSRELRGVDRKMTTTMMIQAHEWSWLWLQRAGFAQSGYALVGKVQQSTIVLEAGMPPLLSSEGCHLHIYYSLITLSPRSGAHEGMNVTLEQVGRKVGIISSISTGSSIRV